MQKLRHNPLLKKALWEAQKAEAIKKEQTEKCYRQHTPPQIAGFSVFAGWKP